MTWNGGKTSDRRLKSAQKRFTKACEALAKVKKLSAEADLKDQQARNRRGKSALIAQKILENATESEIET